MTEHVVATTTELADNDRLVVDIKGREIAVFRIDGEYYAYLNWCAHQGGPCCEGNLTGTVDAAYDSETHEVTLSWGRENEILNCPWHGWEYDILSGKCLSRPDIQLPSYPVTIEDDNIVVHL